MAKVITSPVAKFPGTVTIADPMTFQQAIAFERAWKAATEVRKDEDSSIAQYHEAWLPGLCASVVECNLEGVEKLTPDTFPASPRIASAQLCAWLIDEVLRVYNGEEAASPNA